MRVKKKTVQKIKDILNYSLITLLFWSIGLVFYLSYCLCSKVPIELGQSIGAATMIDIFIFLILLGSWEHNSW